MRFSRLLSTLGFETYKPIQDFDSEVSRIVNSLGIQNYFREILVSFFVEELLKLDFVTGRTLRVAVVGGSREEPELEALRLLGYEVKLVLYGVDIFADKFMDLNIKNEMVDEKFDLVLCSQVLEHVWALDTCMINLNSLLCPGALLWISCPASNRFHGSPEFFSAGYSETLLNNLCKRIGLVVCSQGSFGSHRNYVATHLLNVWLSKSGHRSPLLSAYDSKNFLVRVALTLRFVAKLVYLSTISSKITLNPRFATESWIFAKRDN